MTIAALSICATFHESQARSTAQLLNLRAAAERRAVAAHPDVVAVIARACEAVPQARLTRLVASRLQRALTRAAMAGLKRADFTLDGIRRELHALVDAVDAALLRAHPTQQADVACLATHSILQALDEHLFRRARLSCMAASSRFGSHLLAADDALVVAMRYSCTQVVGDAVRRKARRGSRELRGAWSTALLTPFAR